MTNRTEITERNLYVGLVVHIFDNDEMLIIKDIKDNICTCMNISNNKMQYIHRDNLDVYKFKSKLYNNEKSGKKPVVRIPNPNPTHHRYLYCSVHNDCNDELTLGHEVEFIMMQFGRVWLYKVVRNVINARYIFVRDVIRIVCGSEVYLQEYINKHEYTTNNGVDMIDFAYNCPITGTLKIVEYRVL